MSGEQADLILEKLTELTKLLYGNGHKGLCERIRNLELFYKIGFLVSFLINILYTLRAMDVV